MNEINLIGGFYKSKTLPWSAQDVVNWVPVKSVAGGTRSPMKLRGVPGLRPFDGEVVIPPNLVPEILFTETAAWFGSPPSVVLDEPFARTSNGTFLNFAAGLRASIQRDSSLPSGTFQARLIGDSAPWGAFPPPYSGATGAISSISASGQPGASWRGDLLAVSYIAPESTVRIFRLQGTSWSELTNSGFGVGSAGFNLQEFSDSGRRFVSINASTGTRYRVGLINAEKTSFSQIASDTGVALPAYNCISWVPGSDSLFISAASDGTIEVVEVTTPNVTRRQIVPRPAGATEQCIHVRFTSPTRFIACWLSSLATPVYEYSFDPSAKTATLIGAAPWQPGEMTSVPRNFSSPRSGRYLAYLNGSFQTPRVVDTETWQELTIPPSLLSTTASYSWWADRG